MGACYPDQVGGHKPCVPVVVIAGGSPCGIVHVLATTVVIVSCGRHGATHDLDQ